MSVITAIIKPTDDCNLRCRYCYHSESGYDKGVMSDDILERTISLLQSEYDVITYVWHGGEPLLCGIGFYKKIVAYQQKYMRRGIQIRNNVQTNGTLITDELAEYFASNGFSVCISFDGPGELNTYRGETENVIKAFDILAKHNVATSMLSVVHSQNVRSLNTIYEFAKQHKVPVKMNPVFRVNGHEQEDYLIDAALYIEEFKRLFNVWMYDKGDIYSIEPIDEFCKCYFSGRSSECIHRSCMYRWISVLYDGSVYPCGRNYPSEFCLGNIMSTDSIQTIYSSDPYSKLVISNILRREKCKEQCEYFGLCNGGCNSNCLLNFNLDEPNRYFCDVFIECLRYVTNRLDEAVTNQKVNDLNLRLRQGFKMMSEGRKNIN